MTNKRNLYSVAAFALWLGPEWEGGMDAETGRVNFALADFEHSLDEQGGLKIEHEFALEVFSVMAASAEVAKETGVRIIRELHPEAEGWVSHIAMCSLVSRDLIVEAMEETRSALDEIDEPELVM